MAQTGGPGRNRGGGDPSQFQARRMERYREQLEVKKDDEWKVVQQRIERVLAAESELRLAGFGGAYRRDSTNNVAPLQRTANRGGRSNRGPRTTSELNPDVVALESALDSNAPPEEIKARLAKFRDMLKQKEASLGKARDELRQILSIRQEALAIRAGLLRY